MRMSVKQQQAALHGALMVVAGAIAVALTWFLGVATNHGVSIPILLTALPALLVGLAAYFLHLLQPDAPPVVPPAPPPSPVTPPTPLPPAPPVA